MPTPDALPKHGYVWTIEMKTSWGLTSTTVVAVTHLDALEVAGRAWSKKGLDTVVGMQRRQKVRYD